MTTGYMLRRITLGPAGERYYGDRPHAQTVWTSVEEAHNVWRTLRDAEQWMVVTKAEALRREHRFVLRQGPGVRWSMSWDSYRRADNFRGALPNAGTWRVLTEAEADHLDRGNQFYVLRRNPPSGPLKYWGEQFGSRRVWLTEADAKAWCVNRADAQMWQVLTEAEADSVDNPCVGSSLESLFEELGELDEVRARAAPTLRSFRVTGVHATRRKFGGRHLRVGDRVWSRAEGGAVMFLDVESIDQETDSPVFARITAVGEPLTGTRRLAAYQLVSEMEYVDVQGEADLEKLGPGTWCWRYE